MVQGLAGAPALVVGAEDSVAMVAEAKADLADSVAMAMGPTCKTPARLPPYNRRP